MSDVKSQKPAKKVRIHLKPKAPSALTLALAGAATGAKAAPAQK